MMTINIVLEKIEIKGNGEKQRNKSIHIDDAIYNYNPQEEDRYPFVIYLPLRIIRQIMQIIVK